MGHNIEDEVPDGTITIWVFFTLAHTCPWDMARIGRLSDRRYWICGLSHYEDRGGRELVRYDLGLILIRALMRRDRGQEELGL